MYSRVTFLIKDDKILKTYILGQIYKCTDINYIFNSEIHKTDTSCFYFVIFTKKHTVQFDTLKNQTLSRLYLVLK